MFLSTHIRVRSVSVTKVDIVAFSCFFMQVVFLFGIWHCIAVSVFFDSVVVFMCVCLCVFGPVILARVLFVFGTLRL